MRARQSRAIGRAIRDDDGRKRFPWFAWLVLATMLMIGAALGHAAPAPVTPPSSPVLPPSDSNGFRSTTPETTPGQTLVPPPQHASGGVINPPTTIDAGIAKPTPPAASFPTPVVTPPNGAPN